MVDGMLTLIFGFTHIYYQGSDMVTLKAGLGKWISFDFSSCLFDIFHVSDVFVNLLIISLFLAFLTRLDEAAVALQKEKNMYKEIENFPMCFKVAQLFVFISFTYFLHSLSAVQQSGFHCRQCCGVSLNLVYLLCL